MLRIDVVSVDLDLPFPTYAKAGDAGADLVSRVDITVVAAGISRPTRRIAAINWVTVSCVATASSRTVESNARRVLPARAPVAVTTAFTASKIRLGRSEAANRRRQYVNVVE